MTPLSFDWTNNAITTEQTADVDLEMQLKVSEKLVNEPSLSSKEFKTLRFITLLLC